MGRPLTASLAGRLRRHELKHAGSSFTLRRALTTAPEHLDPRAAIQHCAQLTRKYEFGQSMCNLLLPRQLQATHVVLRAVNIETALVADQAKGELQGRMRLQWWKDAVEAATSDELIHPAALHPSFRTPVVAALAGVWKQRRDAGHTLDRRWLLRSIDARIAALDPAQPQEMYALEKYAEETASGPLYLLLQAAGYRGAIAAKAGGEAGLSVAEAATCRAASHIGNALGLTILLRAAPHYAAVRQCPLPETLMIAHGVSQEDFYRALPRATGETGDCGIDSGTSDGGVRSLSAMQVHILQSVTEIFDRA